MIGKYVKVHVHVLAMTHCIFIVVHEIDSI